MQNNSNTFTVNNLTAAVVPVDVGGDPTVSSSDKPFTTGFSVAFDGNDKMRMEGPGTVSGDFTWECFVKFTGTPSGRFFSAEESVNGTQYSLMRFYNGNLNVYAGDNNGYEANTYTSSVSADTWHHIAMVRSGSTLSHYLDGSRWGTNTYSNSFPITTLVLAHGYSGEYFTGSVSNARFVNGQALYTGTSYTVPTATLTTTSQSATASNVTTLVAHKSSLTANDGTKVEILNSSSDIDSLIDTPTNYTAASGNNGGNYCTFNPLVSNGTLSNGNLDVTTSLTGASHTHGTIAFPSSGKWYYEITPTAQGDQAYVYIGDGAANVANSVLYYSDNGNKRIDGTFSSYGATYGNDDVIGVAVNVDDGEVTFYKNGSSQGAISYTIIGKTLFPGVADGSSGAAVSFSANFGQRPFSYTPPTGYVSLCTQNLPDPTIADGSTAMSATLWTGNGSTQTISGLNHSPDFIWHKIRSISGGSQLYDIVRGTSKRLQSDSSAAESTLNGVTAFNSDGWTMTAGNNNNETYVSWTWDAGSSTVSNTDGSITTNVRASQTNGCSIVTYTGTGSNASIGHGLNAAPELVIVKSRSDGYSWIVWHGSFGTASNTDYLFLESNAAKGGTAYNFWNGTAPTSSVVNIGTQVSVNKSSSTYVAYCFTSVNQYSAFGSYQGNGNADGTFVPLSFRPRWILLKSSSVGGSGYNWRIYDSARDPHNVAPKDLFPNLSDAEGTGGTDIDILSNGFKLRDSFAGRNANGATFIYAAFAEHPFSLNGGLAR